MQSEPPRFAATVSDLIERSLQPSASWSERARGYLAAHPRVRLALQAGGIWLATRLALIIVSCWGPIYFINLTHPTTLMVVTPADALHAWLQKDTVWYLAIAGHGYTDPNRTAFFPLYPFLIHLVAVVIGQQHLLIAGLIVSNLGTLAAFIGLGQLAADESGDLNAARYALLVFAAYPLAFFLGAAYTEGVFIACAVWCLFCMRRGWWYAAAACTFLAMLTRSTGVILVPPLLFEFARRHAWGRSLTRQDIGRVSALLVAVPAALAIFVVVCFAWTGDPLASLHAQATYWHRHAVPPWQMVAGVYQHWVVFKPWSWDQIRELLDIVPPLVVLAVTACSIRRQPVAYTLYTLGLLYLSVASPNIINAREMQLDSAGRFMLAAAPTFLILGRWARRSATLEALLVSGGFVIQAILVVFFLSGGWIV